MIKTRQKRIYLDYAATTPVDKTVLKKMLPYFSLKYGNPSSLHSQGQEALMAIDEARGQIAKFLNCQSGEIIFTSGATESNNLTIKGVIKAFRIKQKDKKPHLITSSIEHHCILDSCESLKRQGLAEVTYLPVNNKGLVRLTDLRGAIKKNTVLISIIYANNEIGAIQPVQEIGAFLKSKYPRIIFHTDAVQAVNYLDCRVDKLGVDLLSLSGHKIYGPKGVGALYIRKGTPLIRLMEGGGQEYNLRAGTHNVPGIVGLGEAIKQVQEARRRVKNLEIKKLRDRLIKGALRTISGTVLNGDWEKRLPNNVNLRFNKAEGEAVLISLDLEGIAVSTASACASKSLEPSHVLLALGLSDIEAHYSVRFSLGQDTTSKEIDTVLKVLPKVVGRLRGLTGNIKV